MNKEQKALFNLKTKDNNYLCSSIPLESEKDFKVLEKALEDLELYKKAYELLCSTYEDKAFEKGYWLDQARKELNNGN